MTHITRRDFLGRLTAGASALTFTSPGHSASFGGTRPPNVVLILSDDQGTLDLGCYGSKDLYTPNLDALAERGIRFTQFYVAAPVCSPSRAGLLTGRYPQRAGVPGNVPAPKATTARDPDSAQSQATDSPPRAGMPSDQVTIAEMLRGAGYRTAIFGKWHLGYSSGMTPNDQGFDEFVGHRQGCIDNYSHFFYWEGPPRHDLWKNETEHWENGTYLGSIIVREAKRFIEENKEHPFFLYLPFNAPHYPLQPAEKFSAMYEQLAEPRCSYAAFVSTLDDEIGQVLAKLDELNLREKTLVIFLSDNGHSTEERANYGGGNTGTYRGAKFSLFEGGIRMPCIASLPGRIPAGELRDQFATSLDWFPTIGRMCNAELPGHKLDGKSLDAVIQSANAPAPHEVFHWQTGEQWAVREGDWKLVVNAVDTQHGSRLTGEDETFLSNLAIDPTESRNLAKDHANVVERLRNLHLGWVDEVQTQ